MNADYDARVIPICRAYREAIPLFESEGLHMICIDEQTGIQALKRIAPNLPVRSEAVALYEYEYKRHGTLCLFRNIHVGTGQIIAPMIRESGNEMDYLENVDQVIAPDPAARLRIIADNLTTHCSESLVRYVADACEIATPLGKKGLRGILK